MIQIKPNFRLRTSWLGLALISLMSSFTWADQKGSSTATFLRIGQGARAEGMGGAFTAIADDAYAIYWNPAGLAQINRRALALNHSQMIEKTDTQFAAFALPLANAKGTLGFAATYVNLGSIDRRDAQSNVSGGETDVVAYAGNVSWGQSFGEQLSFGAGVKFFNQDLAGETGSGFAADLGGLLFLVPTRFALGVSLLNLGPKIKTGTQSENIPSTLTGGAVFYVIPKQFSLSTDLAKERDTDLALRLGGEYLFQGRFIARIGYQDTKEAGGGLSAGAGFVWRPSGDSGDFFGSQDTGKTFDDGLDIRFDYAYVDYGDFDATHRVGVHLFF